MVIELIPPRDLPSNASIQDAFELLAGMFGMVITIIDGRGRLKGIVSAGDLREALLRGLSIKTKLELVMNSDPVKITRSDLKSASRIDTLREELKGRGVSLSTGGDVFAIPVVDEKGRVEGLSSLEILGSLRRPGSHEIKNLGDKHKGKPHVLVVGGAGYIGSILVERLLQKKWKVKVLDRLIYNQDVPDHFKNNELFSFIKGDICDLSTQVDAIRGIDCVVFLAEIVGDPSCEYLPDAALTTNYLAVNSMAALCSHMHINRFIYTSSCSVYGASIEPDVILDEESEVSPVSHYARMKVASEEALFSQRNPLFAPTILRLATVFGVSYRPRFDLVVNTFAKDAYSKELVTVFGGDQWRPNVHVADVAETIIRVIESPINLIERQVFNVGSNVNNLTIKQLANIVAEVFPMCLTNIDSAAVDIRNYRVDFRKIIKHLGYEPELSVRDGLEELKSAFKSGSITDLSSDSYSNVKALKENYSLTN